MLILNRTNDLCIYFMHLLVSLQFIVALVLESPSFQKQVVMQIQLSAMLSYISLYITADQNHHMFTYK